MNSQIAIKITSDIDWLLARDLNQVQELRNHSDNLDTHISN
jgi:hypothetical protein